MKRPNIVLISTDQQGANALSCAGNSHVSTPAMDAMAARGLRFGKSYVSQPLCAPCRTSLQTGRYPSETGVVTNKHDPAALRRHPMLGRLLADAGYQCAFFGKWHVPFSEASDHGYEPFEDRVYGWDAKLPDRVAEFLQTERDLERPLFLTVSFHNPHDICEYARGDELPEGPVGTPPALDQCPPLPPNHWLTGEKPGLLEAVRRNYPKLHPTADWDEEAWRRYLWAYYRLVEKVDAQLARLREILATFHLEDDTLTVFWSDHGEGLAAHQWNQKTALCEEVERVPLIVTWPGRVPPGTVDAGHLVDASLDLLPTFCDYAEATPPEGLPGRSWRPLLENSSASVPWRNHLVSETQFGGKYQDVAGRGYSVHSNRYKYVLYDRGEHREQFHDLREDPGETVNLVHRDDVRDVVAEHRTYLRQWCRRVGRSMDKILEN